MSDAAKKKAIKKALREANRRYGKALQQLADTPCNGPTKADACREIGRAIGGFKQLLLHAVHHASEGRADVARELLESMSTTLMVAALEDFLHPTEIRGVQERISEAIAQKTPSMIERKAKILFDDLGEMEKRAEQYCR